MYLKGVSLVLNMLLIRTSSAEWYTPPYGPWKPDPTFVIPDSDMIAIFLALNELAYSEPVYDPMFLANGSRSDTINGIPFYWTTLAFNIMVCGDQHQICNPSNGVCSKLSGEIGISPNATEALGMNAAQQVTAFRFFASVTEGAGLYQAINDLGAQALRAQNLVSGENFSPGLPSYQWQIEVSHWFEISLAKLQALMVDWVERSWVRGNEQYVTIYDPRTSPKEAGPGGDFVAAERHQCHNQIIRSSTAIQNFSLVGIIIIVVVSCLIIGLELLLEPVVRLCRKWLHSRTGMGKDLVREADDKNTLLRLALEGVGIKAAWKLGLFGIPTTTDTVHVGLPEYRPDGLVGYRVIEDYCNEKR